MSIDTIRPADWVSRHAGAVISLFLLATAALAVPLLSMTSAGQASQEPAGREFDARDQIEERFGGDVDTWFFIVESADGEILDRAGLLAVQERADALRVDAELSPMLVERTDPGTGARVDGVHSFADTVDAVLRRGGSGGLADVDDETVRGVVSDLMEAEGAGGLGISRQAGRDDATGRWTAPALTLSVIGSDATLDRAEAGAGLGSDIAVEELGRAVLTVLGDSDALDVYPVAIDQNLTAQEQGAAAGPFIGLTVLVIVLLVGVAFRSYWVLAIVGGAVVSLLVWLKGLANLVGLKDDQILSTVVPIAMIAFGVDYAFHAIGRYREERAGRLPPRHALGRGLRGVAPALLLALATGAVAFLANTASNVESIIQFGIASAIALLSAFLVLGVVVPAVVAVVDERVSGTVTVQRRDRILAVLGGAGAASVAMVAALFLVFLDPPVGLAVLAGYVVVFVALPAWLVGRGAAGPAQALAGPAHVGGADSWFVRGAVAVALRRAVVLPVVAVLSGGAALLAVGVPASFDVEDFFSPDTTFVVGLDKLDEHVGNQGGEPAVVFVSTDPHDPRARAAIARFADRLAELDTDLLARGADGTVRVNRAALDSLDGSVTLTSAEQSQVLVAPDGDGLGALQLSVGVVGSRVQENIEAVRGLVEPLVANLDAELRALHADAEATLTGAPIVRQASLDAVSRSLQVSLPIAVALCLLAVWVFLRSLRYALVSIVPILLVVAWLYGFMTVAGFSINLVTATIGAISIGIGIDFATHLTMRYREELGRLGSKVPALRAAIAGTGVALAGSTVSSAAGFAILAFAPMPMFASFGLLTAVMIGLAFVSCLLVLPGLLLLVGGEPAAGTTTRLPDAHAVPVAG